MNGRSICLVAEGATTQLLKRWESQLPAFKQLFRDATVGEMSGEHVPYEPSGLYSAFTGFDPHVHGCFSYWQVHNPDYTPTIFERAPSPDLLWHRGELSDLNFAVVNVFGTHPIRKVNGTCISYPMRASMHTTHPRDLALRLAGEDLMPRHDVTIWFNASERDPFIKQVLDADRRRAAAFTKICRGEVGSIPDVAVLNLTSIDRLSHVYWQELDSASPVEETEQAIFAAYKLVDAVLGSVLEDLQPSDQLLVFSEIGFGPLAHYVSINEVLEEADLLRFNSSGNIDWGKTLAFEAVQGTSGININDCERYSDGVVSKNDYHRVRTEVRQAISEFTNPYTGLPFAYSVNAREDIHPAGSGLAGAPDVIIDPADWRYLPLGATSWATATNRHRQSGWHRRRSFWAALGPSFTDRRGAPGVPSQVAATIVAHFGRKLEGAAPRLEMA